MPDEPQPPGREARDETIDVLAEELDPESIPPPPSPPAAPPPPPRARPAQSRPSVATLPRGLKAIEAPRGETPAGSDSSEQLAAAPAPRPRPPASGPVSATTRLYEAQRAPTPAMPPDAPSPQSVATLQGVPAPVLPPPPAPSSSGAIAVPPPPTPSSSGTVAAAHPPSSSSGAIAVEPALPAGHEIARSTAVALEAELATSTEPVRSARLHLHLGRLAEVLTDLRAAEQHYGDAFKLAPELVPAIRGLRRVMIARRRHADALPLFDAEARLTSDSRRRASLLHQKGRLLEETLSSPSAAREAYAAAIELDRSDLGSLRALERCEIVAEAWDALAKTYGREAQLVSGDPRLRAAYLVQRARLAETRGNDTEQAIQLYESALRTDASCAEAIAPLERLYHAARRFGDLCTLLDKVAEHTSDPHVHAMALLRIGRISADKLANLDEGLAALERAARAAPDDPVVLAELDRLYELAGRHDARLELLERRAALTTTREERVALLFRWGEVAAAHVGDHAVAVRAYEAALAIDPRHGPSLQALAAHYARAGDFPALLRVHLAESDATTDVARRAAALARVAEILEVNLGRADEAAVQYARVLAAVPGHDVAFKALCRLHAAAGRSRDLVELHERAVELATEGASPDRERAIASLMRIGALHEDHLREPSQAMHAYRRVLALDPAHLGAMQALQRACEDAGRFEDLVEALEMEARTTRDEPRALTLMHRAAEVLAERIGDRERAIARLLKVIERRGNHAPSLATLARLYQRAGRWDELLGVHRRELEATADRVAKVTLLARMAEICDTHVRREDEALVLWRRALEIDAAHLPSLRALGTKLAARREWTELVRVLERELATIQEAAARAAMLHRIGEVYEDHLGQTERALNAFEQARAAWPAHRAAADAVSRLRAERRDWVKLAEDLEKEAESSADPMLASSALAREGELWREALGQPRRAIKSYQGVLERRPDHVGALLALEALERKIGAWGPLAEVHERLAKTTTDQGARVAALRDLARLLESRGPVSGADLRATYDALLELSPGDPGALEALERLALANDDVELLVRVDGQLAEGATDATVASFHSCRRAECLEARGDAAAVSAFRAAIQADPENIAAARGLRRSGERFSDPMAIAEGARREAMLAREPRAAARLLVQSAAVRAGPAADLEGALADLERALELDPTLESAAHALSTLLLSSGQYGKLSDLLARAATASSELAPVRACALWESVARLQSERLGNVPAAIVTLRRARELGPDNVSVLRALAALLAKDGLQWEAVGVLDRVVAATNDRELRRDVLLELARLHGELRDPERARACVEAVLDAEPEHVGALVRLLEMQRGEDDAAAATTARKLARLATTPRDEAAALVEVGRIELARGQTALAVSALVDAVALEGPGGAALVALEGLPDEADGKRARAEGLRRFLSGLRKDDPRAFAAHLALAGLEAGDETSTEGAVAALRRAMTHGAPEEPMRLAIAERLLGDGRATEALTETTMTLAIAPASSEAWRLHARALRDLRKTDEARFAIAPLVVLGTATAEERVHLVSKASRPARARPASLPADALRAVALPGSYDTPAGV
ncbi:MAG: tetratricopeptide repeat protein, partial [Deltaproteobacteria bacterium]|nr:tetratricopeptide repeat protein [Deltaproteobacteria bacterium]